MSTANVPKATRSDKPEPPPIVAMLRTLEQSCAERDRIVAENVKTLCDSLDGTAPAA